MDIADDVHISFM